MLGSLDLTLSLDPGGLGHATTVQFQAAGGKVAPEVPLVVGALLFAQHRMRMINDPARLAAVDEIDAACRALREGRLDRPSPPPNARIAATYHVELTANGGFRINVQEKIAGILSDVAGGLTAGALATEILSTVREPYRTFYREMLEAAVHYWRERRPSLIESTWVWTLALRRLDQLVRQGVEGAGEPQTCASCKALRPAGFACLHCGTEPGAGGTGVAEPSAPAGTSAPLAPVPSAQVGASQLSQPVRESPGEAAESVTVAPAPASSPAPEASSPTAAASAADRIPERTILPAQEKPPSAPAPEEPEQLPPAGLLPRGLAFLVDLVISIVVATFGGFGLTTVLLALNAISPTDDPRQFASAIVVIFFALYFILGWTGGETFGMLLFHIQVVRQDTRKRCGLLHAIARGFGYLLLLALGLLVFYVGNEFDNQVLVFIPSGTPTDDAIRVIVGLISLYVLWLGSGQGIISEPMRRTWADRIGKTLVVRQKSAQVDLRSKP